jgi:hypothetical protein
VADQSTRTDAEVKADFRQLRRLARTGFAADDNHLIFGDQLGDVGTPFVDRQVGLEFRRRQLGAPCGDSGLRLRQQLFQIGLQFLPFVAGRPWQFALQDAQAAGVGSQGGAGDVAARRRLAG